MKQFNYLNLLFIFTFIFLNAQNNYAQQIDRNYVVVEIGTGTWCVYCPGAAMGADDLVENGHQVAVIENHNGDSHAYTGSNARNSYYGITGYPTAFFDGGNSVVGGSNTSSMYGTYLPVYNTAIAVMSDFSLDLNYTHTGPDYDVTIDIDEVGDYAGTNLAIHLVLTESHIQENWQGQTELNFISRAMYPTHTGTTYTGDATTLNLSFTADAAWDLSNCELVAFIQDNDTKQILQSDKAFLAEPVGTNNIILIDAQDNSDICVGSITPSLKVKNYGTADVSSMTIDYSINSGAITGSVDWVGDPIAFNHFAQITLDEISGIILEPTNTVDFEISTVNGGSDDDPTNNTTSITFENPVAVNQIVNLELHTDGWGSECTWNIKDSGGSIIENGGPYGNNQTINETFTLPGEDCYSFNIIDSYGDGGGVIYLRDDDDNILYHTDGSYGFGETQAFKTPVGASVDDTAFAASLIFPNPTNQTLYIENAEGLNITLFDVLGRELLVKENISVSEQLNVSNFSEGTYLLQLSDGNSKRIEKIVISR